MEPQRDPDVVFGRRLRYLREEAGLTQQQLADVMRAAGSKMHRSTIGKIEAGERVVSVGEAAQFAEVLGIDLREMLNVRDSRLVPVQMEVRLLEGAVIEYNRQLDGTRLLLDVTLAKLEDARARLRKLEAEQ